MGHNVPVIIKQDARRHMRERENIALTFLNFYTDINEWLALGISQFILE
jgi:hypothetical protein